MNCILRRKEQKSERIPITPEILANATMLGELSGERAFWVDNAHNGRIYHLSTDRCINGSGEFCELEIEFVGSKRSTGNASEVEIVGDIAFLSKFMLDRFPQLRPSTLTKERMAGAEEDYVNRITTGTPTIAFLYHVFILLYWSGGTESGKNHEHSQYWKRQ